MVSVSPDSVRNRINLSSSDISDSIVTEFIVDACAEIMLEADRMIDFQNCDQVEASCIRDLAALYCLTYLTGGSTSGTSFTLGDLSVREVTGSVEGPSPAFLQQRVLKLIEKLRNPRILQIHFHTFRHWKATTLYHKTKDLAYVKNFLGHKNVNNTMLYIQLATTIFKDVSDQYISRVAVNAKGARALIEVGFEKVDEFDGKHIYRKRMDPTP